MKKKASQKIKRKGQTLIIGVVALVILLTASLFIFDLQSIIRVKVKSQTAADAAALAACNWQIETLNLIGELNIIKACTVLVSDIPPMGNDSPQALQESADLLSEMQSRIAFVGPVIGFGAAQQAAKNNGMNPNPFYTSVVRKHIKRLSADTSSDNPEDPNDDNYLDAYYYDIPKRIENYEWRYPYMEMVRAVNEGQFGVAAAPNVDFAGLPLVDPDWLMDINLYFAISSEYWCYPTLRRLLKSFDFSGKWWDVNIVSSSMNFPRESEYYPVYVQFTSRGDTETLNEAISYLEPLTDERGLNVSDEYDKGDPDDTDHINSPLPYVKWCVYESRWRNTPDPIWLTDDYLRSGLRSEYFYGGPVAKATCETNPAVVSKSYTTQKSYKGSFISKQEGLEDAIPVKGEDSGLKKKYLDTSTSSALAKPLGTLSADDGSALPPNSVSMVLPVFDKARLIPIAMQDPEGLYNPFSFMSEELYQFLLWLSDVDDIDNPGNSPPGSMGGFFLACLQKLNSEQWRCKGYNRNYVYEPPGVTPPYNPATGTGAGWLQRGYTYQYNQAGEPVAIIRTNEDTCDDWPPGPGPGRRNGPPILH